MCMDEFGWIYFVDRAGDTFRFQTTGFPRKDAIQGSPERMRYRVPQKGCDTGFHRKDALQGSTERMRYRVPQKGCVTRFHRKDAIQGSTERMQYRVPRKDELQGSPERMRLLHFNQFYFNKSLELQPSDLADSIYVS